MVIPAVMMLSPVYAARTPGFSMSAFNAAVPSSAESAVFSPIAFEFDCAVLSEAYGPIEKAKFVEALGALVGYEHIFKPIRERYAAAVSNDFSLVSARALLTPSLKSVTAKYRTYIQNEYSVQACPVRPVTDGAESFLRAAMDGEMEDFRVPEDAAQPKRFSFYDLESFRCAWRDPFPTANIRKLAFTAADGSRRETEMMSDVRPAELWTTDRFTMLRLAMTDGSWFHAVLPADGAPLDSIRADFAGEKFDTALVMMRSITDPGVYKGPAVIVLPRFALDTASDLAPAFRAFELPLGGFKEIDLGGAGSLHRTVQRTRFSLDVKGAGGKTVVRKSAAEEVRADKHTKKFIANRPFLFFVFHAPTQSVPVAGVYVK